MSIFSEQHSNITHFLQNEREHEQRNDQGL